MKGINSEELLNKRVKIKAYSDNEYVGIVTGYVPAQDNEPEVEEISILNEKDNKKKYRLNVLFNIISIFLSIAAIITAIF